MPRKLTACGSCEHYRPHSVGSRGYCMHQKGPLRVEASMRWAGNAYYPLRCPIDPDPPVPPRVRPKKRRVPKPGVVRVSEPPERKPKRGSNDW